MNLGSNTSGNSAPTDSLDETTAAATFGLPLLSFVVPAHNEEACIGRTLESIHEAARASGHSYEVIVVDDACTDATADVARQHQAVVVPVRHRQIAATRNSGARAARGRWLFFVDADTTINARALRCALRSLQHGAVGGGAPVVVEGIVPLYIRLIAFLSPVAAKLIGFTGGAFMFCTRQAFQRSGGFNERFYWAEEGGFALALKRQGRFVVLWERVITSGRRFRTTSGLQMLAVCARTALAPAKMLTRRSSVKQIWYDSNRTNDHRISGSIAIKVSNAVALVILLVLLSGPLWHFVPRSMTPLSTPLGKFRLGAGVILCHVGLVFWPLAVVLLKNVWRQWWSEQIKTIALIGFCVWQGWGATRGVIHIWSLFAHWAARQLS